MSPRCSESNRALIETHMKKYTYKDIKTGKKVTSDKPLKDPRLKLVAVIKDGRMKANEITKK